MSAEPERMSRSWAGDRGVVAKGAQAQGSTCAGARRQGSAHSGSRESITLCDRDVESGTEVG